ncbi:alpha/beta hydrolase family protein [Agromyces mangrovi Wang et al. 2018]|uniref:alpha/beta hydrolase family protein n=1 Tax=Agromyces mangrovi TaxID=1858653 RepID=UPI0025737F1A|nr:alpha/beta family hydrolase [Agromyces mangrovi]BDZ64025.1 alpha/beta hydrolase [Agromyces mangrovi]
MPHAPEDLTLDTGAAEVPAIFATPDDPWATLVIAHGAGAGMGHPWLAGFSDAMVDAGLATLRFDFPYRAAGRRFPDRPPAAIATWRAALDAARARAEGTPVWASGKSYGGRMASMAVAEGADAAGLVFLGYPLHPPGKPEQLRDAHLYDLTVPMLFLQGTNDPFAKPVEQLEDVVRRIGPNAVLEWIDGGGHSFEVAGRKRTQAELGASAAPSVAEFLRQH